jgi:hypothetical protein
VDIISKIKKLSQLFMKKRKKERIIDGLPFLLRFAASFGCQLVYASNLCCQLGMLAFTEFKPGTAAL